MSYTCFSDFPQRFLRIELLGILSGALRLAHRDFARSVEQSPARKPTPRFARWAQEPPTKDEGWEKLGCHQVVCSPSSFLRSFEGGLFQLPPLNSRHPSPFRSYPYLVHISLYFGYGFTLSVYGPSTPLPLSYRHHQPRVHEFILVQKYGYGSLVEIYREWLRIM